MKTQKGLIPIYLLVGILVMVVVGGGAYYFGKSQTPKPQTQNPVVVSQTPQASPNETANPDLIGANWRTYTNAKHRFSFRYPSEFQSAIYKFDWGIKMGCYCESFDWFDVETIPTRLTPKAWWGRFGKEVFNGTVGVNSKIHEEAYIVKSESSKTTGNLSYEEITAETSAPKPYTPEPFQKLLPPQRASSIQFRVLLLKNADYLVVITDYETEDRELFDQILSTFKFIP